MRTLLLNILKKKAVAFNDYFGAGSRLTLIVIFFFLANLSLAQVKTSTLTGGDRSWNNPLTWVEGAVPLITDDVTIVTGSIVDVRSGAPAVSKSLTINGTLSMGGSTATNYTLDIASFLLISPAGTLTNNVTNDGDTQHEIRIGGNFTNNGTFNSLVTLPPNQGTIDLVFNGTGPQVIDGTAATQNFQGIFVNKTAGQSLTTSINVTSINASTFIQTTGDFVAPATFSVSGNIALATGTTFTAGANTSIGGNFIRNNATFIPGTGTVTFNGGTQSVTGVTTTIPFYNLNTSGSANVTANYHFAIANNLTIGDGSTFTLAGNNLNVLGTTTVGGGVSGSLVFTSEGGSKFFEGPVTVALGGTWDNAYGESIHFYSGITNNGTFTTGVGPIAAPSQYLFEVNAAQAINGIFVIPDVFVDGAVNLTNNGTLTASASLGGGGTLTQATNATLNIGGASSIAILNAVAAGNTVNYTGAAQAIKGTDYQNLGLSGTDAKSLNTSTNNISGNLTLSGAVTTSTVDDLTIGGNLAIGTGSALTNGNAVNPIILTISGALSGDGSLAQTNNSTLNINGASTLVSINAAAVSNTVNYNGASPLIIPGPYYNLSLNHTGTAALNGNNTLVGGTLALTTGNLDLGAFNLTLGASAVLSVASPSASRMIITSGAGELHKNFNTIGTFTFHIGETTGTPEYSPITVNVTTGTFASAYISASVVDAKFASNNSTTDYLTRYWNVTQSGITNSEATVSGSYFASDIVGAGLVAGQLSGTFNQITNGWKKFGALSGGLLTAAGTTLTNGLNVFTGIVGANPTVSINGGGVTACAGTPVALTTTATGVPTIVYSWSPATGLSAVNVPNPSATPAATTNYVLTIYDGNGSSTTANTTITVSDLPIVSTPATQLCVGGNITLSPTTGGTWASSDNTKATVTNAGVVTGVATGSVTFTFTNAAAPNCSATTAAVTVNALPVVSTPATQVCVGGTITLSPTTGGTWASSDNTKATVTNAGVVTGVAAGSVTFTFTNTAAPNCSATTAAVTVNALPIVSAPATQVCVGGTITLSPTTGGTWVSSDNTKATVTNGGVVTGVAAGNATFTFTNTTTTCSATTASITVNALPVLTAASQVCVGSTITLSPTTGGNWVSSDNTKATVSNAGLVTGIASGNVTFTFTNTTTNCSATTSTVAVNALPVVTAASQVCVGSTITLSPTSGGTWVSSDNTKATVTNAGVVTGIASGSVTFTFTNTTTTCNATTASVTVNALPVITSVSQVCVGSTINLTPAAGGTWVSSDNTKATVTNAGLVTGIAAGSAIFTFTNTTTGCSKATTSVTVNALPVVTASASQVCVGSTINLTPSAGGTWVSSDNTKATVSNAGLVTGIAAGSAIFTFTNTTTGCSKATTSITVNALPVVSASAAQVCIGSTITLTPAAGGTWVSSDNSKATVTNAGLVTGIAAGNVTFTFTNPTTGCSSSTSSIAVNAPPTVSLPTATLRIGITMIASPTSGGTWVSSNPAVASIDNSGLVTGISLGTVNFTFTNTATGCSNTTSTITIDDLPAVSTSSDKVCVGATITASPGTGGTWASSDPGVATIDNFGLITGISAGTVTFTFTETSTSYSNTTSLVTVGSIPTVSTSAAEVCVGSTITVSPATGGTWISSDNSKATVTNAGVVTGVASGSVTFTFTNTTTGCTNTTTAVTIVALPAKPTITASNLATATPTLTSSSDTGNQWFKNNAGITGATGKVFNVSTDGSYTVQVTANGCASPFSDAIAIVITGIEQSITSRQTVIYPNPTKESIQIDWSEFESGKEIEVRIYDQAGRSIISKVMSSSDNSLDVRSLVQGPYLFMAKQNSKQVIQRFIKE